MASDSPAARAGVRAGDRVLAWEPLEPSDAAAPGLARLPRAPGSYRHALEWRWSEVEYGERGGLRVAIWRAPRDSGHTGELDTVFLRGRNLGLEVRPPSQGEWLPPRGSGGPSAGEPADPESWLELARNDPDAGRAVWLALRAGSSAGGRLARAAFELAVQRAASSGDVLLQAYAHDDRGEWLATHQGLKECQGDFLTAWELLDRAGPPGLAAAEEAADMGIVLFEHGELEAARAWSERGWRLRHRLAPGSLAETASLTNLGVIEIRRGDLRQAEAHLDQALGYAERDPDNAAHVATLRLNLGAVAYERADWDRAEEHWQAGLALRRRLDPGSLGEARALNNLGRLAFERGESEQAAGYLRRSLELRQGLAPDSLEVARSLYNLADAAEASGDASEAEHLHRRSLALRQRLAPDSLDVAESLARLAVLVPGRGSLQEGRSLADEALQILERRAPGSLQAAQALAALASILEQSGRLEIAQGLQTEALSIRRRLAPASALEAESLQALARLARRQGQEAQARAWLTRSVEALESQASRLGGAGAARTGFSALHTGPYEELVDVLAQAGRGEQAFDVFERSRARAFLTLLAQRRDWGEASLSDEQARERRQVVRAYDEQRAALARCDAHTPADEVQATLARLRELGARREALVERLGPATARTAELGEAGTRRLRELLPLVDPGTLLLAFVVTSERTWALAALAPETGASESPLPVLAASIALGEAALAARVGSLRDLLQNAQPDDDARRALDQRLLELGEALLGPVRRLVVRSRRVLMLPDGVLHTVPFAALRCDLGDGEGPRALVEARPLHTVSSASVYAQLVSRRRVRPVRLAAFGRPLGKRPYGVPAWLSWAGRPRWGAVRDEVRDIAALFPGAQVYLGEAATEGRAKALGPDITHIHFASHAATDERLALDAHLELARAWAKGGSQPEDGHLRAWEVMEELHLDADLVTLSACETGLGRDAAGEGLLSLVRAFQFAGARSVLASLWRVDDRSSAALMRAFYARLRDGLPKDEALRAAQLELRGQPEHGHPFHWAAFQLGGDRR